MSSSIILELRQQDSFSGHIPTSNGNFQNGVWETTLDIPILLEEGDQVQVKSVYLDTSIGQDGYISVPTDIPVKMTCAMYLTNYELDQQETFSDGGLKNLKIYPLGVGATGVTSHARPFAELGDNNKWFLSTLVETQTPSFRIPTLFLTLPHLPKSTANITWLSFNALFEYTGTEPGDARFGKIFNLSAGKPFRWNKLYEHNPFQCGVVCAADPNNHLVPDFRMKELDTNHPEFTRGGQFEWLNNLVPIAAGEQRATLQEFSLDFVIPGGYNVVYTPSEMAEFITAKMSNLEVTGNASVNYTLAGAQTNTMTQYPAMSPFLTTVLKNANDIKVKDETIDQVFINADGYENAKFDPPDINNPDGNQNGNLQMKFDIAAMLAEGAPGVRNAFDYWIGSNEVALEFDPQVNKLKFTQQHFPIYSGDTILATGASADDGLPSAVYCPAETFNPYFTTKGIASQYSGLVWTGLSPSALWQDLLGFDNTVTVSPNGNQGFMKAVGKTDEPPPATPNSFELRVKEGVNTTGALLGLDMGVVHSSAGFSKPKQAPLGVPAGNGESAIPSVTTDVSSIYSSTTWNTAPASEGYFLLDIATNFQQSMVGQTLTNTSTQSIVNRYYTADSFTSDQGAGSIVYQHKGEPQMLSSFKVQVLNPDRSVTAEHVLQEKNTVFIEIMKADKGNSVLSQVKGK